MIRLQDYTKRVFLFTGNTKDEFTKMDNSAVFLDQYLHQYLKEYHEYDKVAFLDAKGIYYFDSSSDSVKRTQRASLGGASRFISHPNNLTLRNTDTKIVDTEKRHRYSYDANIVEISTMIMNSLRQSDTKFALVIYDVSLLLNLQSNKKNYVQVHGLMDSEIFNF